jgi:transposase
MQEGLFSFKRLEDFVPADHPLRAIRTILNAALARLNADFNAMYAPTGRDSIAPEKLLRALMLQALYGLRSERALCEHLGYNLLFRWFVGIAIDDAVWDHSSFTTNRDRLIEHSRHRHRGTRSSADDAQPGITGQDRGRRQSV